VAKYPSVMDKRRLVVTASLILEFVLANVVVTAFSSSLRDAPSDRTSISSRLAPSTLKSSLIFSFCRLRFYQYLAQRRSTFRRVHKTAKSDY